MTDNLLFSRDSKVFVAPTNSAGTEVGVWEIPVLEGFSFSQATETSEINISEMSDTSGSTRRGRRMFNDSLAPAEWSFSTYARPFKSTGNGDGKASGVNTTHCSVEEPLWAMLVGSAGASYNSADTSTGGVNAIDGATSITLAANRIGTSNLTTVALTTASDGDGSGAKLKVTYVAGTGVVTLVLDSGNIGQGYTNDDELQLSAEAVLSALTTAFAAAGSNGTNALVLADLTDMHADVNGVTDNNGQTSWQGFTRNSTNTTIDFGHSNKSTLGTANIYFVLGNSTKQVYKLSDCCVNELSIDFEVDGIVTLNWSGMGKLISDEGTTEPTRTVYEAVSSTKNFIRNRLTSLTIGSSSPVSSSYDVVLTGGNITISNNITYLTPETMGVINTPLGHVTGTRNISGNFTCYLNSSEDHSGEIFKNLANNLTSSITNDFDLQFDIGGGSAPSVVLDMNSCHLEVPTHSIDDIISLDVNFHALPSTFGGTDELTVQYKGSTYS